LCGDPQVFYERETDGRSRALIRGRYRFRLLVHGERGKDMQGYIRQMLAQGPEVRGSVQVQVDIDPQSFL